MSTSGRLLLGLLLGVLVIPGHGLKAGTSPRSAAPPAAWNIDRPRGSLVPVAYTQVRIADWFWSPRIERNQRVSLRAAFAEADKAGNLRNFRIAAGWETGAHTGSHAYDSDVYKIVEGAAYSLRLRPDPQLEAQVDRLIDAIAAAQARDGYLNTYFILRSPGQEWEMLPTEHELYCAGHLFEAAVAYAQATGKGKLLEVARRLGDNIGSVFGPGKRYETSGHQEVELALVRLFEATGDARYFELAKFFLDERGYAHGAAHRLPTADELTRQDTVDPNNRRSVWSTRRYRQDHLPVVQQRQAIGHAVRAGYMYAAMADVARLAGDPDYQRAVRLLWADVAGKKQYITGGVGTAQYGDEGFGTPYNLPNEKAYCETCAAVANMLWNARMNLLTGDAKYADVFELALYNGFLSGVSLSGDRFFYENPLASTGGIARDAWSDPACCPSNVVRVMPQLGNFIYATDAQGVYVNLFVGSTATIALNGSSVRVTQTTAYPWEGTVRISIEPAQTSEFSLNVRIPSWTADAPMRTDLYRFANAAPKAQAAPKLTVNGKRVVAMTLTDGYARIRRAWKKGDVVQLELPMPVRRVRAHPKVDADRGRVALMRGPIVYCLESVDNPFDVSKVSLPERSLLVAEHRLSLLGGVSVLSGRGISGNRQPVQFLAVPYFAWANRGAGAMVVWVPEAEAASGRRQ